MSKVKCAYLFLIAILEADTAETVVFSSLVFFFYSDSTDTDM